MLTSPPLIAVVPPLSVVKLDRAVVTPTATLKVVVALSFTVSPPAPFTELANVFATPVTVAFAPSVTASL